MNICRREYPWFIIWIIAELNFQTVYGLNQPYIGCYNDHTGENRALTGPYVKDQSSLTLEGCLAFCFTNSTSTYFGAEYYKECYCGDVYSYYGLSQNDGNCNTACNGNITQMCGGTYLISVYAVCQTNFYGAQCNKPCYCKDSSSCLRSNGTCGVRGCQIGWNGPTCSNDTDECSLNISNCSQICNNTPGSFTCLCDTGYQQNSDGRTCDNINECKLNISGCNQTCIDTPGSYNCSCYTGYTLNQDGKMCDDINECSQNNGGCNQTCINMPGSFTCKCGKEYVLKSDNKGCDDINECDVNNGGCLQNCTNTYGSFYCSCHDGHSEVNLNCSEYTSTQGPGIKDNNLVLKIVLAIIIPLVVCVAIALAILCYCRRRKRNKSADDKDMAETAPTIAPSHEIDKNTNHASLYNNSRQSIYPAGINSVSDQAAYEYETMHFENKRLKVNDLPAHYSRINNNSVNVAAEFKMIDAVSTTERSDFASQLPLKKKNRFKNILPYDSNRVTLNEVNDDPLSTYINASFMQGYDGESKLIAAQGPTQDSLKDFWRMIWEYDVSVIVMLTQLIEKGKKKCEMYWPEGDPVKYDDITVILLDSKESTDHIVRTLLVSRNDAQRTITHLQVTDWPDFGSPTEALPLLCFRQKAKQYMDSSMFTLYHCSAGAGRTGTLLAIDFLLAEATKTGEVDVFSCVKQLREQRMHSVQSFSQYQFIYHAVSEGVTVGNSRIANVDVLQRLSELNNVNPVTGKTVLETEFDILIGKVSDEYSVCGCSEIFTTGLAVKENQVLLKTKTKGNNGSTNAVYVQGFEKKDGYIVMQQPAVDSAEEFWDMCIECNCRTILLLSEIEEFDDGSLVPSLNSSRRVGQVQISNEWQDESNQISACNIYRINVTKEHKSKTEAVYENTAANKDNIVAVIANVPESTESVGERLLAIHQLMKSLYCENLTQGPVVVMGRNSISLCGQFIAVSHISEMINVHRHVDVIQAVLEVKKSLPHFIANLGEYEELYRAANKCTKRLSQPIYTNIL